MDAEETFDTFMRELNIQAIADTDAADEGFAVSPHDDDDEEDDDDGDDDDDDDDDDVPHSLLRYFETSRSRAAACEKLLLEELRDFPTDATMNFPFEVDGDARRLNERVEDEEHNAPTDTRLPPTETEALFTRSVSACPNNGALITKPHTVKEEELKRQIERDFQTELKKMMEVEKLRQKEVELMGKRAQEQLDQEWLLQQELMSDLQRRVKEERRKREEEQKRMKDEEDKRTREEENIKMEAERKGMEEERRRRKEEEERRIEETKLKKEKERKREEEEKRRGIEEEMKRKEEEERRIEEMKLKKEERKREEEEKRRGIEEEMRREEERRIEERKRKEEKRRVEREEKKKREEEKNKIEKEKRKLEEEMRMMKEEKEREKKEEEEEEKRKMEEERIKIEEEAKKKVEKEKRKMEEDISQKEEDNSKIEEEVRITVERKKEETRKKNEKEEETEERKKEEETRKKKEKEEETEERKKEEETRKKKEKEEETEERKKEEETRKKKEKEEALKKLHAELRKNEEEAKTKEEPRPIVEEEKRKREDERKTKEGERKRRRPKEADGEGHRKAEIKLKEEEEVQVDNRQMEEEEEGKHVEGEKDLKEEEVGEENKKEVNRKRKEEEETTLEEKEESKEGEKKGRGANEPRSQMENDVTPRRSEVDRDPPVKVSPASRGHAAGHTEAKRLAWMKDCVPWSELSLRNRSKPRGAARSRRGPRGSAGSSGPPPLCPDALLRSTGWKSLQEVTSVTLEDLPGCGLSTLARCTRLRSLTLRRCGLRSLEGIKQLPRLCHVDVQENDISFVDCENMSSLRVLRLGRNKLTSIHGLTGAERLDVLDLSHNSITRIAGLESMRTLQRLSVDHNQLISTKGLADVYTLLHLSCSHNHLASVEGLENSALLSTLDLRANGLAEPPSLSNQVLLRELRLDDNSISSLQGLAACWLPLMQHLSVAQNRITQLPPMADFVSLANLDLRFNCMSELQNVCESLQGCASLREVHLAGNPLQQERGWRSTLQRAAPGLRAIDDQQTDSALAPPAVGGGFTTFCQAQLQQTLDLQRRHCRELSAASSSPVAATTSSRHLAEALQLAADQRFAHERGDAAVAAAAGRRTPGETESNHLVLRNTAAAVVIQQLWRKYRQKCGNISSFSAAKKGGGEGGGGGGGGGGGRPESGPSYVNGSVVGPDYAAAVIQAFWRGFALRRRLASALAAALPDAGEDDALEEVDVDEFACDEAELDKPWTLSEDSPPGRCPASQPSLKPPEPSQYVLPPALAWRPKEAWLPGGQVDSAGLTVSPETSNRSRSPSSPPVPSGLSQRSEKILEEWGFTDSRTALLMLKRARKMKPTTQKKRRGGGTDPSVRAAFGNCRYPLAPMGARNRSHMNGREAEPGLRHAVREEPAEREEPAKREEPAVREEPAKRDRAQRWLQTQAAHPDSVHFLPEISADVLNGGRVQLVADPAYAARPPRHAGDRPAAWPGAERDHPRRNSHGPSSGEAPSPSPRRVASSPSRRERISHRDNAVQLSGGWGGGKKRDKEHK